MRTEKGQLFTDLVLEVFRLHGLLISEGDRITQDVGLTSARWKVLGAVAQANNGITVPQIGRSMGQSRQAVQRIVVLMIRDGLLIYKDNPDHKRAKLVTLTEAGQEIFEELEGRQSVWVNDVSEKITANELETSLSAMRKLINKLEGK